MGINLYLKKSSGFIFLIWALIISFPFWGFGSASYVRVHDSADGRLATRLALKANLQNDELGYWNPDMFAGIDRLAEGNSFELVNLFFYILPGWLAYAIFMYLQRFVAGFFTFKVLNDQFGVREWIALLPSFFYALFPMAIYNNQFDGFSIPNSFSLAGIPFLLWALNQIENQSNDSFWKKLILAFSLGFLFATTSNFAFSIFVFPFLAMLLFFFRDQNISSILWLIGAFSLGWVVLEHQEIMAAFIQTTDSNRILRSYCASVIGQPDFLSQFKTLLLDASYAPYLVIGFISLAFLNNPQKKTSYFNVLILTLLIILLSISSVFMPQLICLDQLPLKFLSAFNFSRFSLLLPFTTMLLIGSGLEQIAQYSTKWKNGREFRKIYNYLNRVLIIVLVIFLGYQTYTSLNKMLVLRINGNNYENIFQNPFLEYLAEQINREADPATRAIVIAHNLDDPIHPGYLWPYGINTLDGYTVIYPYRFWEFWNLILQPMMDKYPECRYGLKFGEGTNRVYLSTACEVGPLEDELVLSEWFDINLLSLAGAKYIVSQQPISDPNLTLLDTSSINCGFQCYQYKLYVNNNYFPFVMPYFKITEVSNETEAIELLQKASLEQIKNIAVVENNNGQDLHLSDVAPGKFRYSLLKYSADQIILTIETETPSIVQIDIAYSPYWKASLDQSPTEIFPINLILTGIYIPTGTHTLELYYSPPYSIRAIFKEGFR
jgi:hypothetical protein